VGKVLLLPTFLIKKVVANKKTFAHPTWLLLPTFLIKKVVANKKTFAHPTWLNEDVGNEKNHPNLKVWIPINLP
jgi:hypothetical protein